MTLPLLQYKVNLTIACLIRVKYVNGVLGNFNTFFVFKVSYIYLLKVQNLCQILVLHVLYNILQNEKIWSKHVCENSILCVKNGQMSQKKTKKTVYNENKELKEQKLM